MKDIKEAHSDAIDMVFDFLNDPVYLKQVLFENLDDSLEFWGQFENAIHDASDYPNQEEELTVMSNEIKEAALDRLAEAITITTNQ